MKKFFPGVNFRINERKRKTKKKNRKSSASLLLARLILDRANDVDFVPRFTCDWTSAFVQKSLHLMMFILRFAKHSCWWFQ